MWVLAIQDRQYWLLPGKQYTVGRSAKNAEYAVDIVIQESSVSRKHLVLDIRAATADAVSHPSIRSEATVTDLGSRFGTLLDGRALQAHKATPVPTDSIVLRIGSVATAKLRWKTLVVTYATGQTGEAHDTMWTHALGLLGPLDVKLLPYLVKRTSVLVKAGATTSTVYFALASAIPIANAQFLQALHTFALEASANGTTGSLIPDLTPFNPEPSWAPDERRKSCLSGRTFYAAGEESAAALKPIVVAAGGSFEDDTGAAVSQPNTLWVCQDHADRQALPAGSQYVDITSVFSAIARCSTIDAADIQTAQARDSLGTSGRANASGAYFKAEAPAAPARSTPTTRLLGSDTTSTNKRRQIDTETPVQADPGDKPKTDLSHASSRSRRTRMNFFDALTASQSPKASIPEETPASSPLLGKAPSPAPPQELKHPPSSLHAPAAPTASLKRPQIDQGPAKKRRRARAPPQQELTPQTEDFSSEEDRNDPAELDLKALGELAIIDASMSTTRSKPPNSVCEPVLDWNGRPNYKGFKKHSRRGDHSRRVNYDANLPDDLPYDDEFAMRTPSNSSSVRAALRASTPASREGHDESDESLFVATNVDDDSNWPPQAPSVRTSGLMRDLTGVLNGDINDDEFSFTFS